MPDLTVWISWLTERYIVGSDDLLGYPEWIVRFCYSVDIQNVHTTFCLNRSYNYSTVVHYFMSRPVPSLYTGCYTGTLSKSVNERQKAHHNPPPGPDD